MVNVCETPPPPPELLALSSQTRSLLGAALAGTRWVPPMPVAYCCAAGSSTWKPSNPSRSQSDEPESPDAAKNEMAFDRDQLQHRRWSLPRST